MSSIDNAITIEQLAISKVNNADAVAQSVILSSRFECDVRLLWQLNNILEIVRCRDFEDHCWLKDRLL